MLRIFERYFLPIWVTVVVVGCLGISYSVSRTPTPAAPSAGTLTDIDPILPTAETASAVAQYDPILRPQFISFRDGSIGHNSATPARWAHAQRLCKNRAPEYLVTGEFTPHSFMAQCYSGAEPTGQDP